MEQIELEFYQAILQSQAVGSENEHMISKVFFTIDGEKYECNIRQPYGESFSFENDPIEVDTPDQLKGKINYSEFRDAVEYYFRSLTNTSKAKYLIMRGMVLTGKMKTKIHKSESYGGLGKIPFVFYCYLCYARLSRCKISTYKAGGSI